MTCKLVDLVCKRRAADDAVICARLALNDLNVQHSIETARLMQLFWSGDAVKRPGYVFDKPDGALEIEGQVYDIILSRGGPPQVVWLGPADAVLVADVTKEFYQISCLGPKGIAMADESEIRSGTKGPIEAVAVLLTGMCGALVTADHIRRLL